MSFFDAMNVSATGMTAQRLRMDVIAENIANVGTTRAENGGPYKRKTVLFEEIKDKSRFSEYFSNAMERSQGAAGVRVAEIVEDQTPGAKVYDPGHADADADGYVQMPNVNVVTEMVNLISASRAFEGNVTAINITKSMLAKTLEISR